MDIPALKAWFLAQKRDFPWRRTTDPYAIWVAEVMLQQTQAATVVPYFTDWMRRFPTVQTLAEASLNDVIKAWEGLGYYARARHLHAGAQQIVERFAGSIPSQEQALSSIKGLGPYTVAAILSFAFHQKKAAVDGNVLRVLARHSGCQEDIAKPATIRQLRHLAQNLLPAEEPWVISEALIELGATVCRRKPLCTACPLKTSCVGWREGLASHLPIKAKLPPITPLCRSVAVIRSGRDYLIKRGASGALMADLYEFPYFEISQDSFCPLRLQQAAAERYALEITHARLLSVEKQRFTRYAVRLYPVLFECPERRPVAGLEWLSMDSLKRLAFSAGHRRILQQLAPIGFG